jgi:hypothetical protein
MFGQASNKARSCEKSIFYKYLIVNHSLSSTMKKTFVFFAFVAASLVMVSCGPSAEEQAKMKAETVAIEEATIALDSTSFEITKASQALDEALNAL